MDRPVRTRRKEERPGEILDAAFEEFVQKGFSATRLEDVAARAGVTKGTIYVYFDNKEQVFDAMVRDILRPMAAMAQEFRSNPLHDSAGVEEFLRGYFDFFYKSIVSDRRAGEMLRLLIAESGRFPELVDEHYQNFVKPILDTLHEALVAGARAGTLRQSPAVQVPELLLAPALQLNIWLLAYAGRMEIDLDQHLRATIDLILNGLLPRGDEPPRPKRRGRSKPN